MPEWERMTTGWTSAEGPDLRLIAVALGFYREPWRYPQFRDPSRSLPRGFSDLISAFGRALLPRHLEDTAAALGVTPAEALDAARFFLRQVLLAPGAGPWRMLGCEAGASPGRLHKHYRLLIRLFHPDRQGRLSELDGEQAARLNQVYQALHGGAAGAEQAAEGEDDTSLMPVEGGEVLRVFLAPVPAQPLALTARHAGPGRGKARTWSGGWRSGRRQASVVLVFLVVCGGWVLSGSIPSLRAPDPGMPLTLAPQGGAYPGLISRWSRP